MTREEEKRMKESIFELRNLPKDKFPHFFNMMRYVENLEKENIKLKEDIENYRASVQALKIENDKKEKIIKEAIDYINHASAWDWDSVASEKLMQILERTDK